VIVTEEEDVIYGEFLTCVPCTLPSVAHTARGYLWERVGAAQPCSGDGENVVIDHIQGRDRSSALGSWLWE